MDRGHLRCIELHSVEVYLTISGANDDLVCAAIGQELHVGDVHGLAQVQVVDVHLEVVNGGRR